MTICLKTVIDGASEGELEQGRRTDLCNVQGPPEATPTVCNALMDSVLHRFGQEGPSACLNRIHHIRRQNPLRGFLVLVVERHFSRTSVRPVAALARCVGIHPLERDPVRVIDRPDRVCEADSSPLMSKKCHLCARRRGRRACPALGHSICAQCCGSKRLVEVACPPDCVYLLSSQSHPPAAVQRQRERDLRFLLPLLGGLTEGQQQLILSVQSFLISERAESASLVDADIEQATRALADTYETASRGIIYDHGAALPAAERLSSDLKTLIETQRSEGLRVGDADVAGVLRRVEEGAKQARRDLSGTDGEATAAYLQLLKRMLRVPPPAGGGDASRVPESGLIVPG